MSAQRRNTGPQISRRNMLAAMGLAGAATVSLPVLSACGVGGKASAPNGAGDVSGGFDWRKASGSTINILQTPHPYQLSYQPLLKEFTDLTGINVNVDLVPEADYFTKLNTELAGGSGKHDAFMLGAYFIWQYGPPGWIEDLDPWLKNSSATNAEYDFEDIFDGLRTSTRWDFTLGQSARHRWSVGDPVGLREQRGRLQQADLRREGHQDAARQPRRLHPAGRRPDRPLAESLRNLDPRVEVMGHDPPRFHDPVHPRRCGRLQVQRLRADRGDGQRQGDRVHGEVDRDAAQGRTDVVDHLRLSQRHRRSR